MIFDLFFFVLAFFMSIPFVGAWYASSRGKDFWTWYFIGLFLPIISFIILLCLPDKKNPIEKELQQFRIKNKMLGLKNEVPDNSTQFLKLLNKPCNNITFEISVNATSREKTIQALVDNILLQEIISEADKKKNRFRIKKQPLSRYIGLNPDLAVLPSEHLLGKADTLYNRQNSNYTLLLFDVHSESRIYMTIEILRKYIVWHKFEKRDNDKISAIYPKIGPFLFDRWQYELALNDVSYRYKKRV